MEPDDVVGDEITGTVRASCIGVTATSLVGLALVAVALLLAHSWVVSGLTVAFLISAAVTTFDKRVTQARTRGVSFPKLGPFRQIGPETPGPGSWIAGVYWVHIGLLCAILVLNWKAGLLVYIGGFILASTGLLETLGGALLAPSRSRN
jgi:hypothetical protein